MDCIFMDFGLEKRLLGGLGRKSKNESSGGGVCSTIIPLTVVFNYSFRLGHKLDSEIYLVEYLSDKRSLFIKVRVS